MIRVFRSTCGVVGFIFLVSLLDGVASGYLEPRGICRILSGHSAAMSGRLPMRISGVADLAFTSQSPLIAVEFIEVEGNMWRGTVRATEGLDQGEYQLKVHLRGQSPDEKSPAYRVLVFQNAQAYRASFHSAFRKHLGISPWSVTALTLPLMLLAFAASFRLSVHEEVKLNEAGLASVFKVTRKNNTCHISFGLGGEDTVRTGDILPVLDRSRRVIGHARVQSAGDRHATAVVDAGLRVEPDFLVDIRRCPY